MHVICVVVIEAIVCLCVCVYVHVLVNAVLVWKSVCIMCFCVLNLCVCEWVNL